MPVISRLVALYQSRGIDIATGLNPSHFDNYPAAAFTWFIRDGESLTNGLGIALQEIYFLECLFARFRPARLFVIGNAIGWSTLALALLNPDARVLAIDAGTDRNAREGIEFTNAVARDEGLSAEVVFGRSPADVPAILQRQDMAPIDFAFIDGEHSVEQAELDFHAIREHASPGCLYLFHDVVSFGLEPALMHIAAASGLAWRLFLGTPSGMAAAYDPGLAPAALDDIAAFTASPQALALVRQNAWNSRHRHLARWRRSLRKRLARGAGQVPRLP
jgi:predicted O-methyltransferase YrrM